MTMFTKVLTFSARLSLILTAFILNYPSYFKCFEHILCLIYVLYNRPGKYASENIARAIFCLVSLHQKISAEKRRKNEKKVLTKGVTAVIITPVSQTNGIEPIWTALANGVTVAPATLTRIV